MVLGLIAASLFVAAGCGSSDGSGATVGGQVGHESECDANYAGACLNPATYDYDCANGSGDGPEYTGTVTVVGEDHYGLDADGDGTGCELG